ncbi:MAG: thiamine phosphate synthase [Sphingobium sp.]
MTGRHRKNVPTFWLMTDERVSDAALLAAAAHLPKGRGGIVFRHYHTPRAARRALFERLRVVARRRRLVLMLAGDMGTAVAWRADGRHGRDNGPRHAVRPMLYSAPAHDVREVLAAGRGGVDLLFLSPLFPTRSHPGKRHLGCVRFAAIAGQARVPVMAMGGVRPAHRRWLGRIGAAGVAAIDGFTES